MKKLISIILFAVMFFSLCTAVFAADQDLIYDHAFELMGETGILSTENDSYEVCSHPFWRADMAVISYRALFAQAADGTQLSQKLIADGVFTESDFSAATH